MRVIFLGYQSWGAITLQALLHSRHEVCYVLTHPVSEHAYETIWNESVIALAQAHQIPVIECAYANTHEIVETIKACDPDVAVLSNWRTRVNREFFSLPRFGCINIHDALLPRYAGFAPINWAIINGETETGVTVHFVTEDIDLGDILVQESLPIAFTDTATDVYYKSLALFASLPLAALEMLSSNQVIRVSQDKTLYMRYHKRSIRDSLIDWQSTNRAIYNLIRAQSDPYPNAFTYHHGQPLRIVAASLPEVNYRGTPGRIFCREGQGVIVLCGAQSTPTQGIRIERVKLADDSIVPAASYFTAMGGYLGER